jgi:LPS export ABC transporter protein LptC
MVQKKKNILNTPFAVKALVFLVFISMVSACFPERETPKEVEVYNGPLMEVDNVQTLYSDSSVLRVKLKAPKEHELQNGDKVFPEGIYLEFFDDKGILNSTLTANSGRLIKETNLYQVTGNVVIKNLLEKEQLNTEELFWNPVDKKINTDKFVRIQTPKEILTGEGLTANQDFTRYKILKPKAIFSVPE